jgi:hypothetical protein
MRWLRDLQESHIHLEYMDVAFLNFGDGRWRRE